jgi:hypothetical protein
MAPKGVMNVKKTFNLPTDGLLLYYHEQALTTRLFVTGSKNGPVIFN